MIIINNKQITSIPEISEIRINGYLIWPSTINITSCFALGYWVNTNPWTNDLGWKI